MRNIVYLSPTSISLFFANRTEFYLQYLSESRPPRLPQTRPMSVGSAFDAYAKSYLHERLFGKGNDPRFSLEAIFEAQVERQNRDWALAAGRHAFEQYKRSGAISDLMLELGSAIGTPRFEFEIKGVIGGVREGVTLDVGPITLLGKPDCWFINKSGCHVILDWKVNGFCSQASPMQGYVRLREPQPNGTWRNAGNHKNAICMNHNGVLINAAAYLEQFDVDWARQLAIYAWLCVPGDSWTMTSEGPRQVSDCLNKPVTLLVNGQRYSSEGFFKTKSAEVFRVSTKEGYSLDATAEHPVLVDYDGQRLWQPLSKLQCGDKLVLHSHQGMEWEGDGSYEDGYLTGWILGDGFFASAGKQHAAYFFAEDYHLLDQFIEMIPGNYSITHLEKAGAHRVRASYFEELRSKFNLGPEKCLTPDLERASSDFYCGFLSAFFDTDGGVTDCSAARLSQSDRARLEVVQRMLHRLGIASKLYREHDGGERLFPGRSKPSVTKPKFSLHVSRQNLDVFRKRVGFRHFEKRRKLSELMDSRVRFSESFLCEILEVQSIGEAVVYDVRVPGANAFDANGFHVHNCGDEPGGDFVVAVDQLACKPGGEWPHIRVAEHRLRIAKDMQWRIFADAQHCWEVSHSDWIFRDLSHEDSVARCLMLEGTSTALKGEGTSNDRWFSNSCRE